MSNPSLHGSEDATPLMKQYWELKAKAADALLLFRMGDFYELFGEDAIVAAGILDITLTSRDKNKPNPLPMAGVPHHSIQGYLQKLLNAGKKVAIGEQLEDPEAVKGSGKIVRREIVRILTPGIQFDVEGSDSNFLATVVPIKNSLWILACLDSSTGEALVSDPLTKEGLACELSLLPIRHFLKLDLCVDPSLLNFSDSVLVESLPKNYLSSERAMDLLKQQYGLESLRAFIGSDSGGLALGILVTYVLRTQQQDRLAHLRLPQPLREPKSLVLGPNTAAHLDLADLFRFIHRARCALGTRQLKRWMMAPSRNVSEISDRQKGVMELTARWLEVGDKLGSKLSEVYDLERICARVNTGLANPKDSLALGQSLQGLQTFEKHLGSCQSPVLIILGQVFSRNAAKLHSLSTKIVETQREDAPISARDGGIFKPGADGELDRLLTLTDQGQRWLAEFEADERRKTGIPSLKVRYNRVFGYYIEITQAHLKSVPSHYQRKQTMVGAERFFTVELKKFEEDILTSSTKQKSLEQDLFNQLMQEIRAETPSIMEVARAFGELDALVSLAYLAQLPGWCLPSIDDSFDVEIEGGRHPLVDQARGGNFVPNNLLLSPDSRLTLLITGPNMGGKSTVMRQTALILILGQMGAPVPAVQARWGVVSSLYTRIGAQDAIARGQSTFMVEMSELAHILHHSDERSFIVLDEIGRGTSTYDGMSVAWATLEWITTRIRARTLFATHYHELIRLDMVLPLLANAHMAVDSAKGGNSLRFLYELRQGPTNESFGIHVAQLAGLPKPVIERAWRVLDDLEKNARESQSGPNQLSLFDASRNSFVVCNEPEEAGVSPAGLTTILATPLAPLLAPLETPLEAAVVEPHPVLKELEGINVDTMTPLEALNFLHKLVTKAAPTV